jgi:HK97 gp10 family phage protein
MAKKRIVGASRLRRKLQRLPDDVQRELKATIANEAERVLVEMKDRAPVSDGPMQPKDWEGKPREHLRDALHVSYARGGLVARIGLFGARVRKVFFFARYLEFGTKKMAKRPFLFPAWMTRRDEARSAVKAATEKALRAVAAAPVSDA